MDYKKKYEEALNRAKGAHNSAKSDKENGVTDKITEYTIQLTETIFPELKEREVERIRKMLIEQMERWHECALENNVAQDIKDSADAIVWLEKQGEQKTNDKVKSKFKVGDWITDGTSTFQIKSIDDEYYIANDGGCVCFGVVHKYYHLWTIQDAKDGDVLALSYASRNYIQIYKRLYEKGFITIMSVYCFYCVEEDTYYDETDSFHVMNRGEIITPATKEQRDLLFSKMKEAGYEWDAKKKELKKIEQKPAENIDNLHNYLYGEQKPAWSEEDEAMLLLVGIILNNHKEDPDFTIYNTSFEASIAWLKSIKERYTWKPSEESFNNTSCTHLSKKEAESKVWKQ